MYTHDEVAEIRAAHDRIQRNAILNDVDPVLRACVALRSGYAAGMSMYDDEMIGHAEELTSHSEAILVALAKAARFDEIMSTLRVGSGATMSEKARLVYELATSKEELQVPGLDADSIPTAPRS